MRHFFHEGAEAEHLGTVAYYESRQTGLGAQYVDEVESAIALICEAPHRHRIERAPNIRRFRLHKFPYALLYREVAGEVEILAVAHVRMRPFYWVPRA